MHVIRTGNTVRVPITEYDKIFTFPCDALNAIWDTAAEDRLETFQYLYCFCNVNAVYGHIEMADHDGGYVEFTCESNDGADKLTQLAKCQDVDEVANMLLGISNSTEAAVVQTKTTVTVNQSLTGMQFSSHSHTNTYTITRKGTDQ